MITRGSTITPKPALVHYYDLKKNWKKVKPHIAHPEVQEILVHDFNKFTWGSWCKEFKPGHVPTEFENCDWRLMRPRPQPEFWNYTKCGAGKWLVNFSLRLAQLVEPDREWRIINSQKWWTVWDGKHVLFEFTKQAMGVPAMECFELAYKEELKPGEFVKVYFAEHYWMQHERDAVRYLAAMIEALEKVTIRAEEQELLATIKSSHAAITQAASKLKDLQLDDLNAQFK